MTDFTKPNPEFDKWRETTEPELWAKFDMSAAWVGWEAAVDSTAKELEMLRELNARLVGREQSARCRCNELFCANETLRRKLEASAPAISSTDWFERNGWIDINKQRPPMTADTPETGGFFLVLRHDPKRDAEGQYRMEVWFGSVMLDTKYWAKIPAYKK